ncbi:MAG: DUF1385 domain-containing protein [Limnochordia bacterium]|jgi:uncharacterized protein YqhQ
MTKRFSYGGQAVIEGVMMRGRHSLAIAVRRPRGDIVVSENTVGVFSGRFPFLRWPLIRGVVALVEALVIGMKALNFSANQLVDEDEEEEPLGLKEIIFSMLLAVGLTVTLFIMLPAYLVKVVQTHISSNLLLNLMEGLMKTGLFLLYVAAISLMPDIRRVFEYHGAEHKAINAYEAGSELSVDAIAGYSRFHPRCGTSFVVIVMLTGILVFSFFGRPPFLSRVLIHLGLLPVVAGLSYEFIRLAGSQKNNPIVRLLSLPGMWMQYLTTREPDRQQLEVAIRSLESVLEKDAQKAEETVVEMLGSDSRCLES